MTTDLKQLLEQREALDKAILVARQNEIATAVAQVRALISEYKLTVQDVFPGKSSRLVKTNIKVAAKYRDPNTGQTWTGRGKAPKWIENKDRNEFLILS